MEKGSYWIHIITESNYGHIQIHNGPIPEDYIQQEHILKCMNYPDSDKLPDFDPFNCNFDGILSQVIEIGIQMPSEEEEDIVL